MNHRGIGRDQGRRRLVRAMFDTRNYFYDASLQYLAPPWFPTLDPSYAITAFRELPRRLRPSGAWCPHELGVACGAPQPPGPICR